MGSGASKVAAPGRKLGKVNPSKRVANPGVGSSRGPLKHQEMSEDAPEQQEDELSKRLTDLGQAHPRITRQKIQPPSENPFVATLQYRQEVYEDGQRILHASGPKTVAPASTIAAIIQSLQDGEERAVILQSYNLAPETLDRLAAYSIPKVIRLPQRRRRL